MTDPVSIIIKVIKIKIALNRLSRAKENAVRVHMGYPPIIPWYDKVSIGCMTAIRRFLLETFCPCTIYDRNRHLKRQEMPKSTWKRMWKEGTYENQVFKNVVGFMSGMLLGVLLYFMMVFQMDYTSRNAFIIGTLLGPVLTVGLAFSTNIRCIILLVMPQLFSSKGRTFLLLYCMILVMNHPVKNFNKNIVVMSESSTCGQQMALNQTKELMRNSQSPLAGIIGTVGGVLKSLKEFADNVRKSFKALKSAIEEIVGTLGRVRAWLISITQTCNDKMGKPYQKCVKVFDEAFSNCKRLLGWFLEWICHIVTGVKALCNVARVGELLCVIARAVKGLIVDALGPPLNTATGNLIEMFEFNVTIHYKYRYNVSQSKSYTKVKDDIMKDVRAKLDRYSFFVGLVQNVMVLAILYVVFRALNYRRLYLSKDSFDNFYVTFKLRDIDERRMEIGKEGILPLSGKEARKYTTTCSLWLVGAERKNLTTGLFLLIIAGCHISFYLLCDYGLYWLLNMMRKHFVLKTDTPVPPHLKMHVQGEGAIADMYRALVGLFDPMASAKVKIDTTPCLPNPSVPNFKIYEEIGIIFGICVFMLLTESYGLRLRHIIASCYYPKREQQRAVWLYNHILKMKGGLLKFLRRQMRNNYSQFKETEKISIRSRLSEQFPLCRKIFRFLGWKKKYCLSCSKEGRENDMDEFIHCATTDCKAVYCMDCFTDLNNLCTVCMDPIDYGDLSDCSEERDSSEDEEEIKRKKEEAAEKRRRREEARLERRASKRMMNVRAQLGITESRLRSSPVQRDTLVSDSSYSDSSTEESDSDSDSSFDYSYQFQGKSEEDIEDTKEEGDDFDSCVSSSVQTTYLKTDLVSLDIFNDSEVDHSDGDSYLDIIDLELMEMDRQTIEQERKVLSI